MPLKEPKHKKPEDIGVISKLPGIDSLVKNMLNVPEYIKFQQQLILHLQEQIDNINIDMTIMENNVYKDVSDVKDEEGKFVYSNEKKREIEQKIRLMADNNYIKLQMDKGNLMAKLAQAKTNLDYHENRFKALRYTVHAMGIKYRVI